MKPLLLLLTAGLLCNLWPFSSHSVQRNGNDSADIPMTTMDSLEAHVWTSFTGKATNKTAYYAFSMFILFKNNIIYSRRYTYDGTWGPVKCEPFYFYTPGVEDKTDTLSQYGDTLKLFNYGRIGQAQYGRHVAYSYADNSKRDRIITTPLSSGITAGVKSLDIITLQDDILQIKDNSDFTNGALNSLWQDLYHATDKPFPFDKNLKKYYRKMPFVERPPWRGVKQISPLGYDEDLSIRIR